jgi:hypothetical protein
MQRGICAICHIIALNEWFDLSHEDVVNFRNICKIMEERIKCLENNPFFMKKIH